MRAGAGMLAMAMWLAFGCAQIHAQETQAEPTPVTPTPKQSSEPQNGTQTTGSPSKGQKTTTAPVVRRQVAHPNVGPTEPVNGPLTGPGAAAQAGTQPAGISEHGGADAGTIRKKHAQNIERNAVHGSDADDTARFEISFFFAGYELAN